MNLNNFVDEKGFMKPYGENGPLFTSYYYALVKKAKEMSAPDYILASKCLNSCLDENKTDILRIGTDPWSHDNHTGFVCLSKNVRMKYHERLFWTDWWRRIRPRDIIFYNYIAGKTWAKFFMWWPMLVMAYSCFDDYKVRNGRKILKTDGKLLTWLRLNTVDLPITKKICTLIIQNNKEFGSWKKCFEIYFGADHIITNFKDEVYED